MKSGEILSTARYLASTKPSFFLSELRTYLSEDIPLQDLYRVLAPHLNQLKIAATEKGGDYEIQRIRTNTPYSLSGKDQKSINAFLDGRHLPSALEAAIEAYIARKTGKPFDDPVILERLRRAVVAQKTDYWKAPSKRRLAYTKGYSVLGYLAYHFPVYFMQTEYLLQTLAANGLLKQQMAVLDAGTGPGVVPLAIAGFYSRLENATAAIHSLEKSDEHLEAFRYLAQAYASGFRNVTIYPPLQADIRTIDDRKIPGGIDILVFSNVINEFEDLSVEEQADLVLRFADHMDPDGTLLIVEPAEEITATRLRVLSCTLRDRGLTVNSPCSFLWGTRCDPSRCWSFETRPDIRPTRLMEALSACSEGYRYINTDIKYAYVILRKDNKVQNPYRVPPHAKVSRLSKLHLHAGRRINVVAAKMSQDLGDAKTHVVKLCDGTAAKPVYAVLPAYNTNISNELLLKAPYGAILQMHAVIVRYNKKYNSYNLLVGRTTTVHPGGNAPETTE